MSDKRHLMHIRERRDAVISDWFARLDECYPNFYRYERLIDDTYIYFDYLLDIDIPCERHPLVSGIPAKCSLFFEREIPIVHIVQSNQLWVDALLQHVQDDRAACIVPMKLLQQIIRRVHDYERCFLHRYNEITRDLLREREQTITSLHEARLSVMGKMAASMAHEIRNPLTTIVGFLKLIREQTSAGRTDKLGPYLDAVESEFLMINMQITGFLSFSRKGPFEEPFAVMSSNAFLRSVVTMIEPRLIEEDIAFGWTEGPDIQLRIQKIALQQVLSNILNNGIDALSANPKGDKRLALSSAVTGSFYRISVSNNGPEIPANMREALFEPFVSGKKEGTGLGLAICKQIMSKNAGDVTFTSHADETAFHIDLNARFLEHAEDAAG